MFSIKLITIFFASKMNKTDGHFCKNGQFGKSGHFGI